MKCVLLVRMVCEAESEYVYACSIVVYMLSVENLEDVVLSVLQNHYIYQEMFL
jgi:hypothetical protein